MTAAGPDGATAGRGRPDRATLLRAVSLLVRLGLATVWLVSGLDKAADTRQTTVAVRAYQLLPEGAVPAVAAGLPYLEIALGLLLLVGLATRFTAVLSAVVLVVFIAAVISAAARGLAIDCGCFGGGGAVAPGETAYTAEVLRDLGFLALAGWLVLRPGSLLSLDGLVRRREAAGSWDDEDDQDDQDDEGAGLDGVRERPGR